MRIRLLFLACTLFTGCASSRVAQMYDGPARPADEIAVLNLGNDFNLEALDGRENRELFYGIQTGPSSFAVLPGEHEARLSYYAIWDTREDEHETLRSEPFSVKFTAEAGRQYQVAFPSPPNMGAAILYAASPSATIVAMEQPVPEVKVASQKPAKMGKAGPPSAVERPSGPPIGKTQSDLMKFWWEKASDEEKAEFRKWMKEQE